MATLYRSIDAPMTSDEGQVAYQSPIQPGKPTVMASLVLDRDPGTAEHLPPTASTRPELTQPSRTVAAPPAVQRQPRPPATPAPSLPSPPTEKAATQEPAPAQESSTTQSESTDFDWMGENEWSNLKSFMEGHQKKLSEETGEAKEETVQRVAEDAGRQAVQDKTQAELVRRQELARRGQLPRAQVEYISGEKEKEPATGAEQPSSPAAAEPVQRVPEEPEFSSIEPDAESGIKQTGAPSDDAAPISAAEQPIVQRTQTDTGSPAPDPRSTYDPGVQDASSIQEPLNAAAQPSDDEPKVVETGSTDLDEAPLIQRAAEEAPSGPKTRNLQVPETTGDAPTAESEPSRGLGNRILAAARSLFRSSDDLDVSSSSAVEPELGTTDDAKAIAMPGQDIIQRTPVEDIPKTLDIDHDSSTEAVDDVESARVQVDVLDDSGSSTAVIDPKSGKSIDSGGDRADHLEAVPDRAVPVETLPTEDKTGGAVTDIPSDQPAIDLPSTEPASGTGPDISLKAEAESLPAQETTQGPELVEPAETGEEIISEPAQPITSGDEVDTIIQKGQGPGPEAQPPTLQRQEVTGSSPSSEAGVSTGMVESSTNEPAEPIDAEDDVDTIIQGTEASIESRDIKEERQESPHMPSELEYQPGLETELSDQPTQVLPLDAVWPVEKTELPTIIPPPAKQGDISSPGPVVQRKPAGDDMVGDKLHSALKDVAPGQPTDSSIELVTPRRPRPVPPIRPQPPAGDVQSKPAETKPQPPADSPPPADQAAPGEKESPYLVPTEVGDLPSDFWEYLGEKPPPASSEKSSSPDSVGDHSPPDLQREVESSQPLVTQEFPLADVQREESMESRGGGDSGDAGESGESEETSAEEQELDISELARQVFPEIKRRLNVDWERGRGRF